MATLKLKKPLSYETQHKLLSINSPSMSSAETQAPTESGNKKAVKVAAFSDSTSKKKKGKGCVID